MLVETLGPTSVAPLGGGGRGVGVREGVNVEVGVRVDVGVGVYEGVGVKVGVAVGGGTLVNDMVALQGPGFSYGIIETSGPQNRISDDPTCPPLSFVFARTICVWPDHCGASLGAGA